MDKAWNAWNSVRPQKYLEYPHNPHRTFFFCVHDVSVQMSLSLNNQSLQWLHVLQAVFNFVSYLVLSVKLTSASY